MFAILICILTLHHVHAACNVQELCPENTIIQAEIVDQHNMFRREVQPTASDMLKMSYSEEVAASAQSWIDQCTIGHGQPSTRMLNGYELGENLFYSSSPYAWTDVIKAWHSEVAHYLYPYGSVDGSSIGHYTQVIWYSSYNVGCGMTLCFNSTYYYGCRYYRAGNFRTWPPYKVGPPCASCPTACEDKLCTNPCPHVDKYLNCPSMKNVDGCSNVDVYDWCPASCECPDKIIPIG